LDRFKEHHVPAEKTPARFGEEGLRVADPDGLLIELIASLSTSGFESWSDSGVPVEHSLRGFHGVSVALEGYEQTAKLLTEIFGYRLVEQSGNRFRFAAPAEAGVGRIVDLLCSPDGSAGRIAAGSAHSLPFRARDDEEQRNWRHLLVELGYNVSPIMDRTYFHSIYFREPGG